MPHRNRLRQLFSWLALGATLGCSAEPFDPHGYRGQPGDPLSSSVAPAGKVRVFIGQDLESIRAYAAEVSQPRGVVSYTSIQRLEGLDAPTDDGGGPMNLGELERDYPDAPVALGFYMVGALDDVNAGAYDDALARLGERLQRLSVPVLLRIGYEFDAPWSAYEPAAYRAAFRRVREHLRASGATHVETVWQAAASCGGTHQGRPVEDYYPGDDAVDWVSASYFAQASCQLAPLLRLVELARTHRKPFLIAESAPQGYDLSAESFSRDGVRREPRSARVIYDEWYRTYFDFIERSKDVVRAISYINADWDAQGLWDPPYENGYFGDSRVQANATFLPLWQDAMRAEHFEP